MEHSPGPAAGEPESMAGTALERSNLYGFLAAIYRQEPGPELLSRINEPETRAALANAGVHLAEDFFGRPQEDVLEELTLEYTRLFIGPGGHISPHASVHIEDEGVGSLWGESTAQVKCFIESLGFEYKPDYSGLPDHIAVELEFMEALTAREAGAWGKDDREEAGNCLAVEKTFLDKHLILWIPAFCEKVEKESSLSFYTEMARLTAAFIRSERKALTPPRTDRRRR